MQKFRLREPTLIVMLGLPGSGKSFFARHFAQEMGIVHLSGDRIRHELFDEPRFDSDENQIVLRMLDYMAETILNQGMSAIYDDIGLSSYQLRWERREMARRSNVNSLTVWVQTDPTTAFMRASSRDRRRVDEKYSHSMNQDTFERLTGALDRPQFREEFVVISGKYVFSSQFKATMRKLHELKLIEANDHSVNEPVRTPPQIRSLSSPRREPPKRQIRIR